MTVAPYMLGRRGPGRAVVVGDPGGSGGSSDCGFVDQPIVTTTASGNTTINGKVKAGSFGKFVLPLATIQAGRQYTFRYTPHFAQLAQQGKLAMVGFGLKTNNDFHLLGLRGDGSTGLHSYEVYGTPPNGWNAQTGHSVVDGGAALSGTQAGPNFIRLIVSLDGTTVTLKSSSDGVAWNTERSNVAISPFSDVTGVTTFGLAMWFNNADAGPFSIDIDQFADADAGIIYDGTTIDNSTSKSVWTFSNISVGAADANRRLYALFHVGNVNTAISSVTIGGVTATQVALKNTGLGTFAMYYADVPTGTTATVVITTAVNANACILTLYRTTFANPVLLTPFAISNFGGTTLSQPVSVANGGAFMAMDFCQGGFTQTFTYNGTDSIATDDVRTWGGGPQRGYSRSVLTTEDAERTYGATLVPATSDYIWAVGATFMSSPYDSFNPLDIDTNVTLSNKNLKVTHTSNNSGTWSNARGRKSYTTGKLYFEAIATNLLTGFVAGACVSSYSLANFMGGVNNLSISIAHDGKVYVNGTGTTAFAAMSTGDVVSIALDLGAQKMWARKNGGNWNNSPSNDPATGVGGISFPTGMTAGSSVFACGGVNVTNDAMTMNFGGSAFSYSIPSGYSAWG